MQSKKINSKAGLFMLDSRPHPKKTGGEKKFGAKKNNTVSLLLVRHVIDSSLKYDDLTQTLEWTSLIASDVGLLHKKRHQVKPKEIQLYSNEIKVVSSEDKFTGSFWNERSFTIAFHSVESIDKSDATSVTWLVSRTRWESQLLPNISARKNLWKLKVA